MQDIRIPSGWRSHPKRVKLARRFQAEGVLALLDLWSWISEQPERMSTGSLRGMDAEDVAIASGLPSSIDPDQWVEALVELGFLDREAGVLSCHDWEKWQPYLAGSGARVGAAKRAAAARWRKRGVDINAPRYAEGMRPASGGHTPRIKGQCGSMPHASRGNAPSPDPDPDPDPSPPATATLTLDHLVARFGWGVMPADRERRRWHAMALANDGIHEDLIEECRKTTDVRDPRRKTAYFLAMVEERIREGWEPPEAALDRARSAAEESRRESRAKYLRQRLTDLLDREGLILRGTWEDLVGWGLLEMDETEALEAVKQGEHYEQRSDD